VRNSESAPCFRRAKWTENRGQPPALSGIERADRSSKARCCVCTLADWFTSRSPRCLAAHLRRVGARGPGGSSCTTQKWISVARRTIHPTHYVDINARSGPQTPSVPRILSQDPGSFYGGQYHEPMQRFRGMEYRCQAAEAFVSALRNPARCSLPV
jgi:hypothetical protein